MNKENDIILELLNYDEKYNKELLFSNDINWMNILGYLTYHRIAGLAFEKMEKIGVRSFDYPIYLTTQMIHQAQKERTLEQNKWINLISKNFDKNNIEYVFLKGSILNNTLFKYGSRVSNDIDILIKKEDIEKVTNLLNNLEFIQGKYDYKNKKIIEFSQEEINNSILTRGETASFVKKSENPAIETIDVDINFSIDWNPNNEEIVNYFIKERIKIIKNDNIQIFSLNYNHYFIELCIHFFKDSSLIDILKKRKVLDLYKFVDIYYFIRKYFNKINVNNLYEEISRYNLEKYIYFSLSYITEVFPDCITQKIKFLLEKTKQDSILLNTIFDQNDVKTKLITLFPIKERIFEYDLIKKYKEINDGTNN